MPRPRLPSDQAGRLRHRDQDIEGAAGGVRGCAARAGRRAAGAGVVPRAPGARPCDAHAGDSRGGPHVVAAGAGRRRDTGDPGRGAGQQPQRGGALAGHDAVAEDAQPDGTGQAGDAAHPALREPHEPLAEAGIQHRPAAGAGFGGRRRGPARDPFPVADRRLVLAPPHDEPRIVSRHTGLAGLPGEGPGDRVQAAAAFVAVAGRRAKSLGVRWRALYRQDVTKTPEITWLAECSLVALGEALRVVAPELSGYPLTVPGPAGKQDPLWHSGSEPLGDQFFVKFAWSRPAALQLAHEIAVLAALARGPAVPFLPEVVASSTDPVLLITRRVPGASLFEVAG